MTDARNEIVVALPDRGIERFTDAGGRAAIIECDITDSASVNRMVAQARERFERDYLVGLLKLTDGNVADEELQALFTICGRTKLLGGQSPDRWKSMFKKIMGQLQKHGLAKVLADACQVLPKDLRETAFALAVTYPEAGNLGGGGVNVSAYAPGPCGVPVPTRVRFAYADGRCLTVNTTHFPCAGISCPLFLGDCASPGALWDEAIDQELLQADLVLLLLSSYFMEIGRAHV